MSDFSSDDGAGLQPDICSEDGLFFEELDEIFNIFDQQKSGNVDKTTEEPYFSPLESEPDTYSSLTEIGEEQYFDTYAELVNYVLDDESECLSENFTSTDETINENANEQLPIRQEQECDKSGQDQQRSMNLMEKNSTESGCKKKEKVYCCLECDVAFDKPFNLKRHKISVSHIQKIASLSNPSNSQPYKRSKIYRCFICGVNFERLSNLKRHKQSISHVEKLASTRLSSNIQEYRVEKPFKCNLCSKEYCQKVDLVRHEATHTGEKRFFCEMCGLGFYRKVRYVEHMRSKAHHVKPKLFKSSDGKESSNGSTNLSYQNNEENQKKTFSCTDCGKNFKTLAYLKKHLNRDAHIKSVRKKNGPMEDTQSNDVLKPFQCIICSKMYTYMRDFKEHLSTHVDTNQFYCKICDKRFARHQNYEVHLVSMSHRAKATQAQL